MKDGTTKKEQYYGFRARILCNAKYGLPINWRATLAHSSEQKLDKMIKEMAQSNERYKLEKMENLMADAGYHNGDRNKKIKEEYNINPTVDIRHMWMEEKIREVEN